MGKTIAEKIFDAHIVDTPSAGMHVIRLDAVFCHEITTPIAINDLVARGKDRVFDPKKIMAVIDHVTPAKDSNTAQQGKTLREWARRLYSRHSLPFVTMPQRCSVRLRYSWTSAYGLRRGRPDGGRAFRSARRPTTCRGCSTSRG